MSEQNVALSIEAEHNCCDLTNRLQRRIMDWNWATVWTAIGALGTWAAVGAIFLAARQFRFDVWRKAQDIFMEDEFRSARTRLFRHLSQLVDWNNEDQADAFLVCRQMDDFCRLATFFAVTKLRGQEVLLETWGNPLGKSWALLEPFMTIEREIVGWEKKWNAFYDLGGEAFYRRLNNEDREKLKEIQKRLRPQIRMI